MALPRHVVGIQKCDFDLDMGMAGIEGHVLGHGWFGCGTTSTIPSLGRSSALLFTNPASGSYPSNSPPTLPPNVRFVVFRELGDGVVAMHCVTMSLSLLVALETCPGHIL